MTVFSIRRQPYILIRISVSRWTRSLSRFSLTCSSWRVIYSNSTVVLIACDTAPLKPTKTYSDVVDFLYQLRSFARTSLRLVLRLFCSVGFPYRSFRRRCSMVIDKFLEGKWTVSSMFPLFSSASFFHYPRLLSFYESSSFRVQQITDTIVGRLLELTRALFKIRASTDFLLFQLAFASQ